MKELHASQPVRSHDKIPTGLLICAILLISLLPVQAAYYAFTRSTPPWVQWLLVAFLTGIGIYLFIVTLLDWRVTGVARRWLGLVVSVSFVACLDGLFLFTKMPFTDVWGNSCLLFFVLYKAGTFLIDRRERRLEPPAA